MERGQELAPFKDADAHAFGDFQRRGRRVPIRIVEKNRAKRAVSITSRAYIVTRKFIFVEHDEPQRWQIVPMHEIDSVSLSLESRYTIMLSQSAFYKVVFGPRVASHVLIG